MEVGSIQSAHPSTLTSSSNLSSMYPHTPPPLSPPHSDARSVSGRSPWVDSWDSHLASEDVIAIGLSNMECPAGRPKEWTVGLGRRRSHRGGRGNWEEDHREERHGLRQDVEKLRAGVRLCQSVILFVWRMGPISGGGRRGC